MASDSPARSPVFAWLAKWNDRPYRVELPAGISLNDPKRSELLTEVFFVSSGPRLFVHAIERKLAARGDSWDNEYPWNSWSTPDWKGYQIPDANAHGTAGWY